MSDEFEYEVTVIFSDGEKKTFISANSYDTTGHGIIIVWMNCRVDNEYLESYSIPVSQVRDIRERFFGEQE